MTQQATRWILPSLAAIGVGLIFGGVALFTRSSIGERGQTALTTTSDRVTEFIFIDADSLPLLITASGQLLTPGEDGSWQVTLGDSETMIRDVYVDGTKGKIWAATTTGVKVFEAGQWREIDTHPAASVMAVQDAVITVDENHEPYALDGADVPLPMRQRPEQVLMLGDEQQVVRTADGIYVSIDTDNWQALETPGVVSAIWRDETGELLAHTASGVMRWGGTGDAWEQLYPMAGEAPFEDFQVFNGLAFATVNGQLLRFDGQSWTPVTLGRGSVYLSQLEIGQDGQLWLLDTVGARLWSSADGENWQETVIRIADNRVPDMR